MRELIRLAVEKHFRKHGCFPTSTQIARAAGLQITRQAIQFHLRELRARGLIGLSTDGSGQRRLLNREGRLLLKIGKILLTPGDPAAIAVKLGLPAIAGRMLRNLVKFS